MTQTSIPFLQHIHDEALNNGYLSVDLPQQQGVVVLPVHYSTHEQIDLLQQLIANLKTTEPTPELVPSPPVVPDSDCQVTVEERAQLFKFLQP